MPTKRKNPTANPPPQTKLFALPWDKLVAEKKFKKNLLYVLL